MSAIREETVVESVTDADFRAAMGRFSSGVTVVTARQGNDDWGATVSAFSSVSNNPPTVLICLNTTSDTGRTVRATGSFVVNILSRHQEEIARRFARKGNRKFDGLDVVRTSHRHPVLRGNHVTLECQLTQEVRASTHLVFIAQVEAIRLGGRTSPLAYHAGRFGRFAPASSSRADVVFPDFGAHHHDLW